MIDAGSIGSLISSAKTAVDMARGLSELRDQAAFQTKQIDLQQQLIKVQAHALSVQAQAQEWADRVRQLEVQLADVNNWSLVANRYEQRQFGRDRCVYVLRSEAANGQPQHKACPNCFHSRSIVLLHLMYSSADGTERYDCKKCKAEYELGDRRQWPSDRVPEHHWMAV